MVSHSLLLTKLKGSGGQGGGSGALGDSRKGERGQEGLNGNLTQLWIMGADPGLPQLVEVGSTGRGHHCP